jgi:hypothetical protein
MKTTVELPDDLFRRAKSTAAARGVSLKHFFRQAVEERLRGEGSSRADPPWKRLVGQLAPLRKETQRIQARIDEEFGRVDEDDA